MWNMDLKNRATQRKLVFFAVFVVGLLLLFSTTTMIIQWTESFDSIIGPAQSADQRMAYLMITLFGMVGYFVESVLERVGPGRK